jgi:hypothetical protein
MGAAQYHIDAAIQRKEAQAFAAHAQLTALLMGPQTDRTLTRARELVNELRDLKDSVINLERAKS